MFNVDQGERSKVRTLVLYDLRIIYLINSWYRTFELHLQSHITFESNN